MYYYGGGNRCNQTPIYSTPCMTYTNNNSSYAIILVLFILLVIVLGARGAR